MSSLESDASLFEE